MNRAAVIADRILYGAAISLFSVHGLYHVWTDLMGIQGPKNPLFWLWGDAHFGLMMHIGEWPLIITALVVAFWNTKGRGRKAEAEETDTPDGMHDDHGDTSLEEVVFD